MFSKTTRPALKTAHQITCNVKSVVCGGSKNTCRLKVMVFSNKHLLLSFLWESGFLMGSDVIERTRLNY